MMFILNFDYVADEESDNSTEKISPTSPTKSDQSEYFTNHFLPTTIQKKKMELEWSTFFCHDDYFFGFVCFFKSVSFFSCKLPLTTIL